MDIFSSSVKSQNDSAFSNAASPFIRTRLNVKGRPTTWARQFMPYCLTCQKLAWFQYIGQSDNQLRKVTVCRFINAYCKMLFFSFILLRWTCHLLRCSCDLSLLMVIYVKIIIINYIRQRPIFSKKQPDSAHTLHETQFQAHIVFSTIRVLCSKPLSLKVVFKFIYTCG